MPALKTALSSRIKCSHESDVASVAMRDRKEVDSNDATDLCWTYVFGRARVTPIGPFIPIIEFPEPRYVDPAT
jgi:hypothetical protein